MNRWFRIGAWIVLGLLLLWVVSEILRLFLGFLSWLISTVLAIVVVALVLYLVYLGISKYVTGPAGGSNRLR